MFISTMLHRATARSPQRATCHPPRGAAGGPH